MPRRKDRRRPRRSLLKIRAMPLVRMPKSVFFAKIADAARTGVVPSDIMIATLNWDYAEGGRYHAGQVLSAADRQELRNCYQILTDEHTDIRFERL